MPVKKVAKVEPIVEPKVEEKILKPIEEKTVEPQEVITPAPTTTPVVQSPTPVVQVTQDVTASAAPKTYVRPPMMNRPPMNSRPVGNTYVSNNHNMSAAVNTQPIENVAGFLDDSADGHGVLRPHFSPSERDVYISSMVVRRIGLRPGDYVEGTARKPKENEKYWGLVTVTKVNGKSPAEFNKRVKFHNMTPIYPNQKITLEMGAAPLSNRVIDLVAPIGRGQRGMVVAPPKAGKTTIMKDMMTGIAKNYPEIHLMAVLIGERPEEVTDIRRHLEKVTEKSAMVG